VQALRGQPWSATAPTAGQQPTWNGSAWVPGAAGLPGAGGTGIVVQTGPSSTVARAIAAGPGIAITNGNGVAGNPIVALQAITGATTFPFPFNLSINDYGQVVSCGTSEQPAQIVELARLGLPFSGGTWSPAEFIGLTTSPSSTPVPTEAGGFLECDGKSRIDRFTIKTATPYPPFVDYTVEIWQLDEFGNSTQAISDTTGLPILINVPAGSTVGLNTTDVYTQRDNITLQVRSDPSVGWSPIQCQVVARRVKAII
jgi:hypothetical protein